MGGYDDKLKELINQNTELKARVLELQDAITTALACMTTEDESIFNEILCVAQRNQYQSLLLHDAEVLIDAADQVDYFETAMYAADNLRETAYRLRSKAKVDKSE